MKIYKVNSIKGNRLIISGKSDDPLWERAEVLDDFLSPWSEDPIGTIEFRALHDGQNLYVCYRVQDRSLHIDKTDNSKKSVDNSDRVELFLRSDKNLDPYYCLEIDPMARVQDFIARPNRQFDFTWNWPKEDVVVKSHITDTYFTVEIVLSILSLNKFQLLQNDGHIEAGIYRAKYNQQSNGDFEPTWITWVDPQTETPDFHIASSFGKLKLEHF